MSGGEKDAHDIVAHAVRVASVHEQFDSVVKKRKKKSRRVVHAVTLEEEGLIDLHITAWCTKSAIYTSARIIMEQLTFKGTFYGNAQSGFHFVLVQPFVNV
jgi:hypothetical protein